jgi:death-on-curing protein
LVAYLSIEQVLEIHSIHLERYGGGAGLRDRAALESAVARPAMTFDGDDLYRDLAAKAAALMHSLVANHPFVDGNKRVGAHAAVVFLSANDATFACTADELYEVTMSAARGELAADQLTIWFRQRIVEER